MNNHCFALVVLLAGTVAANAPGQNDSGPAQNQDPVKADPAATKLMSDTHPSWAHWENFPGFDADLEVNLDGKVSKGKVRVSSQGKVKLDLPPSPAESYAKEVLESIVVHRLGQRMDVDAPAVFADENTTHPLGRAIRVLKSAPGRTYRVRDRAVTQIDRLKGEVRNTHSILENRPSNDKKYLTISFVGNTWDTKTGALRRSEATHQTWERFGKFDLPMAVTTITASVGNQLEVAALKLSNVKLAAVTAEK